MTQGIKYLLFGCLALTTVLTIGNCLLYNPPIEITENIKNLEFVPLCDTEREGHSKCTYLGNDNSIKFSYKKEKGYPFPYAGLMIRNKNRSFFKIDDYSIHIKAKTKGSSSVGFRLEVFAEGFTDTNNIYTYVYNQKLISGENGLIDANINLGDLEVPFWWTVKRDITSENIPAFSFNNTAHIVIDHDPTLPLSQEAYFELLSLTFIPNLLPVIIFNSVVVGIAMLLLLLFYFVYRYKIKQSKVLISAPYLRSEIPLSPSEDKLEKVTQYLSQNYTINTLSLSIMAGDIGISGREISEIIKDKYQTSFPQYLNFLRIAEAKNLLANSSMQVKEIAFAVGYDSQQHFLRVFKMLENKTPSMYKNDLS